MSEGEHPVGFRPPEHPAASRRESHRRAPSRDDRPNAKENRRGEPGPEDQLKRPLVRGCVHLANFATLISLIGVPLMLMIYGRIGPVGRFLDDWGEQRAEERLAELEAEREEEQREASRDSSLFMATVQGATERVEELLAAGEEPSSQAIFNAGFKGHREIIELFAEYGVPFDGPPTKLSPLHAAARNGHVSTVELLLSLGASAAAPPGGQSALELARENGHEDVAALLEVADYTSRQPP